MRKAITLNVKLYIEGDAPPPQDFYKLTAQAVKDMLAQGQKKAKLKITVKEMNEVSGDADDDVQPPATSQSSVPSADTKKTDATPASAPTSKASRSSDATKAPAKKS